MENNQNKKITKKEIEDLYNKIPFKNLDSSELSSEQQTLKREATMKHNQMVFDYETQERKKENKTTIININ